MRNIFKGLALAISASFIVACGGGGPMGQALDHQLAMLKIVEANKTDVAKATSELEAYIKTNEASIKKVNEDMEKMQAELKESKDMAKAMDMMKDHAARIQEVSELKNKLREEAKDVMGDDKVRELVRSVKAF